MGSFRNWLRAIFCEDQPATRRARKPSRSSSTMRWQQRQGDGDTPFIGYIPGISFDSGPSDSGSFSSCDSGSSSDSGGSCGGFD